MNELKVGDIRKFKNGTVGVVISVHKSHYVIITINGEFNRIFKGQEYSSVKLSREVRSHLSYIAALYKEIDKFDKERAALGRVINDLENEIELNRQKLEKGIFDAEFPFARPKKKSNMFAWNETLQRLNGEE